MSVCVVNYNHAPHFQPPPAESLLQGLELLYALGGVYCVMLLTYRHGDFLPPLALDDGGKLTQPLGERMSEIPLNPMFARMLLLSGE